MTTLLVPPRTSAGPTGAAALAAITVVGLGVVLAAGADLSRFSSALGVAVFGLILWRLASTWDRLTGLEHALAVLLAVSPLVASIVTYAAVAMSPAVADNPWLWLVVVHRAACILLVIHWTRWIGRAPRDARGA